MCRQEIMVKLVGVVGGDMMKSGEGRECLARRQITLGIEADLKMVVALDDSCLACGPPRGPEPVAEERKRAQDWDKFLKNYWR